MAASDHLGRQFIPIENLQPGHEAREEGTNVPHRLIAGPSKRDRSHPWDTDDMPMMLADFGTTWSPHRPAGTMFEVTRK